MDVVALAQYGLVGAVATLGTAAGTAHLDKAFRYANEVVFCFDGDEAGRRAAARALEVSLPALRDQRQVRFLFLAEGDDPDSYVRARGLESFTTQLEKARPLSEYLFEQAGQGLQLDTAEGRAGLVSRALPMLARLPEGPFRQQMFIDLSLRTQLDVPSLQQMAAGVEQRSPAPVAPARAVMAGDDEPEVTGSGTGQEVVVQQPARPSQSASGPRIELSLPESLLHLLLHYPHLHQQIVPDLPRLRQGADEDAALRHLVQWVELLQEYPGASRSRLLGLWQGRHGQEGGERLYALAGKEHLIGSELLAARQLQEVLARLLATIEHETPLERLIAKSRQQPLSELEKHELTRLLQDSHRRR